MSDFKRELRYSVFKLKNLTEEQNQRVYDLHMELGPWNDVCECVVVESDWPNYQDTWADIQAVSEGRYISRAELQAERDQLAADYAEIQADRDKLQTELFNTRKERDALVVYIEKMRFELSACQSVLFQLARAGEVTPAYADDAKKILQSTPVQCLAKLRADAIESVAADSKLMDLIRSYCGAHGAMLAFDRISVLANLVRQGGAR